MPSLANMEDVYKKTSVKSILDFMYNIFVLKLLSVDGRQLSAKVVKNNNQLSFFLFYL